MKLGQEMLPSFKIANINFRNTYALNGDLKGLKEQIPNFGGVIGQPIINKANWLIHYPNRKLEISDTNLADNSFRTIKNIKASGAPYTLVTIDGKEHKAIIDLGSTACLSIPDDSPLARQIAAKYRFQENKREIYSIGGLQTVTEQVGEIPGVKIGDIEFGSVKTDIRNSSQLRLGMRFFENHILYIDNADGSYKVKAGR
jgi:hypothetical protein